MEILKAIGMTDNESKIYLALLKSGHMKVTEISHKVDIHRSNIYDSLGRLIDKGIVSYTTIDNKKVYEAANPKKLKNIIKEQEELLNKKLPELMSIFNLTKQRNQVKIFEGREGLKTIFDDFILTKKEVLMYGVPSSSVKILKYFLPHYHKERIKRKICTKAIFNQDAKDRMNIINDMDYATARYLPQKNKSPASTNVYGDKIAIILWSENPLIIQIESKEIADSYRDYFNLMWKIAKL